LRKAWYAKSLVGETWFEALLVDLGFGPDERPGGLIVVGDERVDVGDEFGNAGKGGAGERFCREDREPDFSIWLSQEAWVGV
jgi:hypothetical protein